MSNEQDDFGSLIGWVFWLIIAIITYNVVFGPQPFENNGPQFEPVDDWEPPAGH